MIMEDLCNRTPLTVEKTLFAAGLELGTGKSGDQRLTHLAI